MLCCCSLLLLAAAVPSQLVWMLASSTEGPQVPPFSGAKRKRRSFLRSYCFRLSTLSPGLTIWSAEKPNDLARNIAGIYGRPLCFPSNCPREEKGKEKLAAAALSLSFLLPTAKKSRGLPSPFREETNREKTALCSFSSPCSRELPSQGNSRDSPQLFEQCIKCRMVIKLETQNKKFANSAAILAWNHTFFCIIYCVEVRRW